MTIAYGIAAILYAALVIFWIVRAIIVLAIQEPSSRVTISLQKSFFSMSFASGKAMLITSIGYALAAMIGYLAGFPIAASAIAVYNVLQVVQWFYTRTETNQKRFNELMLGDELCGELA